MGEPRLVLLDEPAAGVNPVMVGNMERHIRDLNARGLTFFVVEHDMQLVMRLSDTVIVLDHGTTIATGPPGDVQCDPLVLDAYLGFGMTGISIRGLVAGYGQDDILRGVDLEVERGPIACVIGPNGAGKSTVLKAISGLVRCRLGGIMIGGTPVTGWSARAVLALGTVHVPQERSLFPLMTCGTTS